MRTRNGSASSGGGRGARSWCDRGARLAVAIIPVLIACASNPQVETSRPAPAASVYYCGVRVMESDGYMLVREEERGAQGYRVAYFQKEDTYVTFVSSSGLRAQFDLRAWFNGTRLTSLEERLKQRVASECLA
jgi:hypothetical protein